MPGGAAAAVVFDEDVEVAADERDEVVVGGSDSEVHAASTAIPTNRPPMAFMRDGRIMGQG